jgi:hypothetical protein
VLTSRSRSKRPHQSRRSAWRLHRPGVSFASRELFQPRSLSHDSITSIELRTR